MGGSAKAVFSIKTNIHLRNPENKWPGSQNDCPSLKIDPQAFKITAYFGVEAPRRSTPRAQRNGTVPGYARSALDTSTYKSRQHISGSCSQLQEALNFRKKPYSSEETLNMGLFYGASMSRGPGKPHLARAHNQIASCCLMQDDV